MIFDLSLGLDPWGTGVLGYWSAECWSAEVLSARVLPP